MAQISVVTYKRKSKREEVDREIPLERQNILINSARDWKDERDKEVIVAEIVDQEVSGSTDQRAGLARLLAMGRNGEIDRIYVGITHRFFRDLPTGPQIISELRELMGIELIFGDVLINQNDPYYLIHEDKRFSDAKTTAIEGRIGAQTGQRQLFQDAGNYNVGGRARYGYQLNRVERGRTRKGGIKYNSTIGINEETFPIVREILNTYAEGELGIKSIAGSLNERLTPPPAAWDSYGNLIVECKTCKRVEKMSEVKSIHPLCPKCDELLIFPRDRKWIPRTIAEIIREAEWTYSGHYRWNYHYARIKHGPHAGQYKGGFYKDDEYVGAKYKPASQWKIRRDNHAAAIDTETAKRIIARREKQNKRTPAERRRTTHPFMVVCGSCGSPYSKRGDHLLSCSGRDTKKTNCNNRGIKEEIITQFMLHTIITQFKMFPDMDELLERIKDLKLEKQVVIKSETKFLEAQRDKKQKIADKFLDLYADDLIDKKMLAQKINPLAAEIAELEEKINRIKSEPLRDTPLINGGNILAQLVAANTKITPETMEMMVPHMRKIISFIKLYPPDFIAKTRNIDVFYTPAAARVLRKSVPKGI